MLLLVALLTAAAPSTRPLPVQPSPLPEGARLTRLSPAAPMGIGLNLELPGKAELEALVAAQHDPRSPQFRRFLTPGEIGARFGQPLAAYEQLAKHFETRGLHVQRWPTRMRLDVTGPVGAFEALLGIRAYQVALPDRTYRTFRGTPTLPAELASMVRSVGGLDSARRLKPHIYSTASGTPTFGPADLRAFYDVAALHSAGYTGQNQKVAMLGSIPGSTNAFVQSDITTYFTTYSGASASLVVDTMQNPNQLFDTQQMVNVEESMDAELLSVGAPGAMSVTMVLSPYDQLLDGAFNYIVNNHPDFTAISLSFGDCEAHLAGMDFAGADSYLLAGNAEGQSWFAASGDDGAQDCASGGAAVDFPAAAPHMVGVGGTEYTGSFDQNNAVTAWSSEQVWNETAQGGYAGGGGVSTVFAKPSWQTGAGTNPGAGREVPDLSALAAQLHWGIGIIYGGTGNLTADGSGTSAAAPLTAGLFAAIASRMGCRIGSPLPELYSLGDAQQQGGAAVFHDITAGDISFGGVTGPSAHAGYDEASGWGSLDVNAMATAFAALGCSGFPQTGSSGSSGLTGTSGSTGGSTSGSSGSSGTTGTTGASCDPNALPSPCGPGYACYPSGTSSGGTCGAGCTQTSQCGSNVCDTCISGCVPPGNNSNVIGGTCTQDSDCPDSAGCITQASYGWPGGYCTEACSSSSNLCSCPAGSTCADSAGFAGCLASCSVSAQSGCRSGYTCWDLGQGDHGGCMPACSLNNPCLVSSDVCTSGVCAPPAASTSGSTGSSTTSSSTTTGATSSTTSTTSSTGSTGTAGTTSTSSSTASGSAASTTATSGSAGSSGSAGASSSTGGATTGTAGTNGVTGSPNLPTGSSGSTGSSGGGSSSGCGCTSSDAGLEGLFALAAALAALSRRRVR